MIRPVLDLGAVAGSIGVARVLVFLASLLLARRLDLQQFGAFTIAYTLAVLLGQVTGGLDIAFVRFSATAEEPSVRRWLRAFLPPKLVVAVAIALAAPAAGPLLARHLFEKKDIALPLTLGIVAGGFFNLCTVAQAYFQARRRVDRYALITVGQGALVLAGVGAWWMSGSTSLVAALSVYAAAYAAIGIVSYLLLLATSRQRPAEREKGGAKELLNFARWLVPAHLAWLGAQRLDVLLLARLLPLGEAGIYGGAVRVLGALAILTGSLPVVFLPRAARALETSDRLRDYLRSSAVTVALLVAAMAVAIVLAPWLVHTLLGQAFHPAIQPLRWLVLSQAFLTVAQPAADLLVAAGHSRTVLFQRLIQFAVAAGSGPPLILALGLPGGALAALATAVAGCAFVWGAAWRRIFKAGAYR